MTSKAFVSIQILGETANTQLLKDQSIQTLTPPIEPTEARHPRDEINILTLFKLIKEHFHALESPTCLSPSPASPPVRGGGVASRGRALRRHHIWARHRLCVPIGCGPPAAACQQDGLPPPAVLTLIILVSPRTYRKSSCHFKIDSGRAAARSPDEAHTPSDLVGATDRHSVSAFIRKG